MANYKHLYRVSLHIWGYNGKQYISQRFRLHGESAYNLVDIN